MPARHQLSEKEITSGVLDVSSAKAKTRMVVSSISIRSDNFHFLRKEIQKPKVIFYSSKVAS